MPSGPRNLHPAGDEIDEIVITMEQEALKMVELMHGQRERDVTSIGKSK